MIREDDDFEWDDENRDHIALHDVADFEAEEAVTDPDAFGRREGRDRFGNARYVYLGKSMDGRTLFVVLDRKGERRWRVATARPAKPRERSAYNRGRR